MAQAVGSVGAAGSLCCALSLAWLLATRRRAPDAAGRPGPVVGIAAGYASLPAWCVLSGTAAGALGLAPGPAVGPGAAAPALLPALLLVGPAFEELLYRERLTGALALHLPAWAAVMLSSAAFALPHPEPRQRVATFLVGIALGAAWLRWRSLPLCIGFHAGLNVGVVVAGVPPVRASLAPLSGAFASVLILALGSRRPMR